MRTYLNTTGFLRHLYPKSLIWDIPNNVKNVYLTFDDGPTPEVTDKLLDVLKSYGAKATFFCLGKNVEQHPELYLRILKEGHQVGNHTWDHLNAKRVSQSDYFQSIAKAQTIIDSKLFRPPYGRIEKELAKRISKDYKIIMWSVLSGDFDLSRSKEDCLKSVQKYATSGSVIVFHDSLKAASKMLYMVPKVLSDFQERGYNFKAINDDLIQF